MEANIEEIRGAVSDVFSDFYNQVIKKRFDGIDHEMSMIRKTLTEDNSIMRIPCDH